MSAADSSGPFDGALPQLTEGQFSLGGSRERGRHERAGLSGQVRGFFDRQLANSTERLPRQHVLVLDDA